MLIRALSLAAVLALPAPAQEKSQDKSQEKSQEKSQDKSSASSEKGPRVVQEADKVVVRKRTVIDFNDVTVEGELTKPEGSYLMNRNKTRFQSLIRLRDNFNPELQKSADNL